MIPLVAIPHYHLGNCAHRAHPGIWSADNSLSFSCQCLFTLEQSSVVLTAGRQAFLSFHPLVITCIWGGEAVICSPIQEISSREPVPTLVARTMYDKMGISACNDLYVLTGHMPGICDLACPFQTDRFKNCISIKVACLALVLSVKSHPFNSCIFVFLGSNLHLMTEATSTMELKGRDICFFVIITTLISIFSLLGEEKQPGRAQQLQKRPAALPFLPAQKHGQIYCLYWRCSH